MAVNEISWGARGMMTSALGGVSGRRRRGGTIAMAFGLLVGSYLTAPGTAWADPNVPPPALNRVWAGCSLDYSTVNGIRTAIASGTNIDGEGLDVSFIVVYSLGHTNDGQPLTTGGTTGPIICLGEYTAVAPTTEQKDLPNE